MTIRPVCDRVVAAALIRLDGSVEAAVSALTGFSLDELNDLGGFREGSRAD